MDAKKITEMMDGLSSFMNADEIHGYKIKEWSTTQFTRLYPYLSMIVKTLIETGATIDNFKSYLSENISTLTDAIIPHMVQLIVISCPGKTEADIDNLPWTAGIEVCLLIIKKNMEHLADFFVQKSEQIEKLNGIQINS